jgi:hypothetical protein
MSLSLSKDLEPVLLCDKCNKSIDSYSTAYIIWNELDRLDDDIENLETFLMHGECIDSMLLQHPDIGNEVEDLKTTSVASYIVKLIKRNSIDASVFIVNEHGGGNNLGQ